MRDETHATSHSAEPAKSKRAHGLTSASQSSRRSGAKIRNRKPGLWAKPGTKSATSRRSSADSDCRRDDHFLPAHVEGELRRFLDCGILGRAFCRLVCDKCGAERVVGGVGERKGRSCFLRANGQQPPGQVEVIEPEIAQQPVESIERAIEPDVVVVPCPAIRS
ncbi:MAG: hypothetical protein JXR83_20015 [Deltaproteobacteria bacterium]|nr:hypothetical protein [Deltaproteobacteria bacterium]